MKEVVLLELAQNNKIIFVSVVYLSPSQSNNEFNQFLVDFAKMLRDINQWIRDFNARSSCWCDDINTTEGTNLLSLTSCNGFQQIIKTNSYRKTNLVHWFSLYGPTKPTS